MKIRILLVASLVLYINSFAQPIQPKNSAGIKLALEKLQVLGSVLYIAAHPDDENTAVLSYFSLHKKMRTGYLSLTRGDGGQNLIGPEKGDLIGVIRTLELMEGRKVDGVEQFFTRAIDFGYTKSEKEAIEIWGEQEILSDIVYVLRKFKPDVIITRFSLLGIQTHGQHTASASLAVRAFNMAGDPTVYPEHLEHVDTWQAKRIVWDSWLPYEDNDVDLNEYATEDIGEFNKLLGKSYTELSAESRSKHRSQGFGARGRRGSMLAYFQLLDGDSLTNNLLSDVDLTWGKVPGADSIINTITGINNKFESADPSRSIEGLLQLYNQLSKMPDNHWGRVKKEEVKQLIRDCSGLWFEAIADDYAYSIGDSVKISIEITNRSQNRISLSSIELPYIGKIIKETALVYNENLNINESIIIPDQAELSQPFWLKNPHDGRLFAVEKLDERITAQSKSNLLAQYTFKYDDIEITYDAPLLYRWVDRVTGEHYRNVAIHPHVTVNLDNRVYIFPDNASKDISVKLKGYSKDLSGKLGLKIDNGWLVSPESINFSLSEKYSEDQFQFTVTPPAGNNTSTIEVIAEINGDNYTKSIFEIDYEHIPRQAVFTNSAAKMVKLDMAISGNKIGYIEGAGDEIPQSLQVLGYDVVLLSDDDIESMPLDGFDAIIAGIRAYNTRDRISYYNDKLLEYVYNGGNLIVQYNVAFGLQTEKIGPYDFTISRDRVTRENAEVTILKPDHSLLNYPNKITTEDFNGWVQERGLYFSNEWSEEYETIISCYDPGEEPKEGGLIYTRYGEGSFIYTGYSWFRQLPAGVPGAYRIFANLISGGKRND